MSRAGALKVIIALGLLSALTLFTAPLLGLQFIGPAAWLNPGGGDMAADILWKIRIPRVALAYLAGAGLGMSGLVFQAIFRNPLADPFTLGVSSGASLGATVYFSLGFSFAVLGLAGSTLFAFLGAAMSMAVVYLITRLKGAMPSNVMLLAGVIINFFFASLVMFLQYMSDFHNSRRIVHWLMGSLSGVDLRGIFDVLFLICLGFAVIWSYNRELDLISGGEELAVSRGVDTNRAKLILFLVVSFMVGGVVSLCGPIGFVGMMAPHICRLWLGYNHFMLIPAATLLGGLFLTLCDLAARLLMAPLELPVGVITALLGGPFFLWVLFRQSQWQNRLM